MTLLSDYLGAVGTYLHGRHRRDILRELEENLRSQIEEREAELGSAAHRAGTAGTVCSRTAPRSWWPAATDRRHGTLTFGRQLIGPEFFPIYVRVLLANWIISTLVHGGIAVSGAGSGTPWLFLKSVAVQFVIVTAIFCVVDLLQRRSGGVPPSLGDHGTSFPPVYMREVPRWQSLWGFLAWVLLSVWWALIPAVPALLVGTAAAYIRVAAAWDTFYWPTLLLLLAGVVQRAVNYARPDWNWLLPVTRLGINTVALALVYPMSRAYPYFAAFAGDPSGVADSVARGLNATAWWTLVAGFSVFFFSQIALNGWQCVQHVRFLQRQRQEQS